MAIKSEFDVETDKIEFRTKVNNDRINIQGIVLAQAQAQNLTSLIKAGQTLTVTIKAKVAQ